MTEINGIAHTMLTVSNFEVCREFYLKILAFMGLKPVIEFEGFLYFAGGRTAFGICLLYTSPSPRDQRGSRMPSSA